MCLVVFSETQQGIFDAVLKGHIDFDSDPWPLISESAKDLIRKMLCMRPSERLTAHEVLCMLPSPIIVTTTVGFIYCGLCNTSTTLGHLMFQ